MQKQFKEMEPQMNNGTKRMAEMKRMACPIKTSHMQTRSVCRIPKHTAFMFSPSVQ